MAAPKLYRYDDANAPVLSGTRGALINILKKCLIDGYGGKTPPGGWTVEFENAEHTIAVFRSSPLASNGFFLRVNEATSANAYTPNLKGYELMTDIDNGVGQFGNISFGTSDAASAAGRVWAVVADEKAFYFIDYPAVSSVSLPIKTHPSGGFFWGDIKSIKADDHYGTLLAGFNNGSTLEGLFFAYPSTFQNPRMTMARKLDGLPASTTCAVNFTTGPQPVYMGAQYFYIFGYAGIEYTINAPLLIATPYLSDGLSYSCRGWVPGFHAPCHPCPFNPFTIIEDGGKTFIAFTMYQYVAHTSWHWETGQFFISLDDWRV